MTSEHEKAKIKIAKNLNINAHHINYTTNTNFNNIKFTNFLSDKRTKKNYIDINKIGHIINENILFNKLKINIASLQYKIFCKTNQDVHENLDKYEDYITTLTKLINMYNIYADDPEKLSMDDIVTGSSSYEFNKILNDISEFAKRSKNIDPSINRSLDLTTRYDDIMRY